MNDRTPPSNFPVRRPGASSPTERKEGGYQSPPTDAHGDPAGFDLRPSTILGAVKRHFWVLGLAALLGVGAGFFFYQFFPPQFSTRATLWVETAGGDGGAAPIQTGGLLDAASWLDLLRSYVVLEQVVEEMGLFVSVTDSDADPDLLTEALRTGELVPGRYQLRRSGASGVQLRNADGDVVDQVEDARSGFGAPLGLNLVVNRSLLPQEDGVEIRVRRLRDAAQGLAGSLDAAIDTEGRSARFMRVGLSGNDPGHIARTVNLVIDRFIEVAGELKTARTEELTEILQEQLASAQLELEQAEQAFEAHQRSYAGVPGGGEGGNPIAGTYYELQLEEAELERDIASIRRALDQADSEGRLPVQSLEVVPSVRASSELLGALQNITEIRAELRGLLQRYTSEHPPVQRLQADLAQLETSTVPALATALLSDLETRQQGLEGRIQAASGQLQQIPARAVEDARLRRQVDQRERVYEDLQRRYTQARLGAVSTTPDIRVVDRAEAPSSPDSDRRPQLATLAFLGFLGAGFMGAILLDRADRRVRSPDQVELQLGLPLLGAVPHVRDRPGRLDSSDHEQAVEAFRNIRMAVSYAVGSGSGPLALTVTSPGVGDGKSFLTSNLGLSFADLGRRTLIIDGDVRKGTQHTLLACERRPGLSDFLAGTAELDEVIRETEHPGLFVIPRGSNLTDAPELLTSERMESLVDSVSASFDVVLVDTAPLGAAVDPYILGALTGQLVLVLRNGQSDTELAEAKLEGFQRLPVRVIGAVLNDVPSTGAYRYYGYISGYGVEDAEETSPRKSRSLITQGSSRG